MEAEQEFLECCFLIMKTVAARHPTAAPCLNVAAQPHLWDSTSPLAESSLYMLFMLGHLLKLTPEREAAEVAWKLSKVLINGPVRQNLTSGQILEFHRNLVAASYECVVFLLLSSSGFRGCFLSGTGRPDLCFPEDRLIIECKDLQTDWIGITKTPSLQSSLGDCIEEGANQLLGFLPEEPATRILFIDLPDKARQRVVEMTDEDQKVLLDGAISGRLKRGVDVMFTCIDVNMHPESGTRSVEAAAFYPIKPSIPYSSGASAVEARVRQRLGARNWLERVPVSGDGLPFQCPGR